MTRSATIPDTLNTMTSGAQVWYADAPIGSQSYNMTSLGLKI